MNDTHNRIIYFLILMVLTAILTMIALRKICDLYVVENYYGQQKHNRLTGVK